MAKYTDRLENFTKVLILFVIEHLKDLAAEVADSEDPLEELCDIAAGRVEHYLAAVSEEEAELTDLARTLAPLVFAQFILEQYCRDCEEE